MKPPAWVVPSKSERFDSATIDLVVWTVIWIGGTFLFSEIAYAAFGRPAPTHDPRNEILLYSLGIAALCANLYLGIANGTGRSVGKFLCGLRLVVFVGQYPAKPGLARGLVRSALQAGPWMGIAMYNSGAHDKFAGTTVIKVINDFALDAGLEIGSRAFQHPGSSADRRLEGRIGSASPFILWPGLHDYGRSLMNSLTGKPTPQINNVIRAQPT